MRPKSAPYWKKIWSYITPVVLEESSSIYNNHLEVLMINGRHQLNTEDAIYSYDDKYENFNYTFGLIDWHSLKGQKVLCLGLGLGSVILMLEKKWLQNFEYTAIEIDPEICRMAHQYTTGKLDSYIEVINTDAELFLEQDNNKYDLIIMDIFQSASIPNKFQSRKFIQRLKDGLTTDGLLMYNRMMLTNQDKNDYDEFKSEFVRIFPNYKAITINQNIVIINEKTYLF